MDEEEISTVPGMIALVMGIVSIVLSLVGVVAAFGGAFFSMCCAVFGWVGAVIPIIAAILSIVSLVVGIAIRLRGSEGEEDQNPTFAVIGIALSALALVVSGGSVLVAMWSTIVMVIYIVVATIMGVLGIG